MAPETCIHFFAKPSGQEFVVLFGVRPYTLSISRGNVVGTYVRTHAQLHAVLTECHLKCISYHSVCNASARVRSVVLVG